MSIMDADPPELNISPCLHRQQVTRRINVERMLIKTYQELSDKFHSSYPNVTETATTSFAVHQSKLDALMSELDPLPPCLTFNCNYCTSSNLSTPVVENASVKISNSKENNTFQIPINATSPKIKKKIKKRKINKNDSVEDFVFPKKTAWPVSPSVSEPVVTTNSISDLESEEIKNKVETEEIKTAELPKPKPPYPIHLKIKNNFRNQVKQVVYN
ncbi:uncharacterized protein TNCV_3313251 [Trichonephila clavipes]|nr:uncharacterized protein TNCV_3313251 [Trichonephila clavipes]